MRHTDLLNWQRSSTVKSLSLKWEFFLLKRKKMMMKPSEIKRRDRILDSKRSSFLSKLVLYCKNVNVHVHNRKTELTIAL